MAQTLCKVLGIVFILVGLLGFAVPNLLGFHLTPIHNIIHILTGILACYFGFAASYPAARSFCIVFGIVYFLLGVLGFVAPGVVAAVIGHPMPAGNDLGPDNAFHLVVGLVFLGVGLMRPETRAAAAR